MARNELHSRRVDAVRAWTSFVENGDAAESAVRPEILSSWTRSGAAISPDVREAPLADEGETHDLWQGSPLHTAVERVEAELRRTCEDGDLVVAVTDAQTRILWTYGGRVMRRKAESVNFVAGARWDDQSVGTNALDLANRLDRPAMVFSAEHYAPIVHNWVCWAAPVHDPVTGRQLGVLDLSTTWDRTHPIGLATARVMARLIESAMPRSRQHPLLIDDTGEPGLVMRLLGTAETRLDGQRLLLNRRQTEVLALLAMHPEGLSLEHLHALVYGDQAVTLSTLKAEVSHLRAALGGQLSSRPYRLPMPVAIDVDHVLALLRLTENPMDDGAFVRMMHQWEPQVAVMTDEGAWADDVKMAYVVGRARPPAREDGEGLAGGRREGSPRRCSRHHRTCRICDCTFNTRSIALRE